MYFHYRADNPKLGRLLFNLHISEIYTDHQAATKQCIQLTKAHIVEMEKYIETLKAEVSD